MDLGLKGKRALVTGGSRGLGRAIALALAGEGCRLSICARGREALEATAEEVRARGAEVLAVVADVTIPENMAQVVEETARAFGGVDILVNNVGGSRGGGVLDEAIWREVMELNLVSAVRASRLVVPLMERQGWGRIINIASVWGRESGGAMVYNAAKAALISFTKALANQVAHQGILVNSVAPGPILFPGGGWHRRQQADPQSVRSFIQNTIPLGRFGTSEEVAALVVFLASERASFITGACITVDGGGSRSNI